MDATTCLRSTLGHVNCPPRRRAQPLQVWISSTSRSSCCVYQMSFYLAERLHPDLHDPSSAMMSATVDHPALQLHSILIRGIESRHHQQSPCCIIPSSCYACTTCLVSASTSLYPFRSGDLAPAMKPLSALSFLPSLACQHRVQSIVESTSLHTPMLGASPAFSVIS